MSVDDLIEAVLTTVKDIGQLESTYFFYTSDHGFQACSGKGRQGGK